MVQVKTANALRIVVIYIGDICWKSSLFCTECSRLLLCSRVASLQVNWLTSGITRRSFTKFKHISVAFILIATVKFASFYIEYPCPDWYHPLLQTPRSDYFPWQYIISLPPAKFFAQIQADIFFNYIFSGLISSKYSFFFFLQILHNHNKKY